MKKRYMKDNLREEVRSYILDLLLTEGIETKNMRLAKHFLYKHGHNEESALKVIGSIKTDIPNSRLCKCKFMLGLVRMFINQEFNNADIILELNNTLRFVCSDAHVNEYDNDLNGISAIELVGRFSQMVTDDLIKDMDDVASEQYVLNNEYTIVKIHDYDESYKYGEYVSWCVTHDEGMYNSYTHQGSGVFYFCLRNGFESLQPKEGENCPLDEYGLSMIAVSVNSNGSCNTITCRWNHDNNGNDQIMTTKQLSRVIGRNFYETFKPLTKQEIEENKERVFENIYFEVREYSGYYDSPREMCNIELNYDPFNGDKDKRSVYVFSPEEMSNCCILIHEDFEPVIRDVYDSFDFLRSADIITVGKGGKYNLLTLDGNYIGNEWFNKVNNIFEIGISTVYIKGRGWNVLKKDGTYLFDEWYKGISLRGGVHEGSLIELINSSNAMNYTDLNGNFIFDRWINKMFRADEHNTFIRFDGDDYYMLYDSGTWKLKATYKIGSLQGYYPNGYAITLPDDRLTKYVIDDAGNIYDMNKETLIYKNS